MVTANPIGSRSRLDELAGDSAALVLCFSNTTLRQVKRHVR
jgi:hypothetical protein